MGAVVELSTKDRKKTFSFRAEDVERWEQQAKHLGISLTALIEQALNDDAAVSGDKTTRQLIEEIHAAVTRGES